MKNIKCIAIVSAFITLVACEQHKKSTVIESGEEVVKVRTPKEDTITKTEVAENTSISVGGIVTDINMGKDGYTATIETSEKEIYHVTISHANLKDPKQYKQVEKGAMLNVSGDYWKMDNQNQVTVRTIN